MRRRAGWASLVLFLGGCAQVEPSGGLFEAAPGSGVVAASATAEPSGTDTPVDPAGGFDFAADGRDADAEAPNTTDEGSDESLDRLAAGLGIEADLSVATPPAGAPAPAPSVAPPTLAPTLGVPALPTTPSKPPAWKPGDALDGSFGVRLVSTVVEGTPPRAILGMPDGSELVVKPGTMLPDHQLVVLAIGRNAVQVAEVRPSGDHAMVTTQVLSSLYPTGAVER